MPEQVPRILKFVCVLLAALVLYQIARIVPRANTLGHVVIPLPPTLSNETNSVSTNVAIAVNLKKGTNLVAAEKTNSHATSTNLISIASTNINTNAVEQMINAGVPMLASSTNVSIVATNFTNVLGDITNLVATNILAGTNAVRRHGLAGTNGGLTNLMTGTNAGPMAKGKGKRPGGAPGGFPPGMMMMGGMGMGMGAPLPELAADVKARVDRIYESEILGQAIRPLPAGLLGIAGDEAFLRSASGQTGMIKEGETLGDLKLVRIGINRVLVEAGGEQKELMIFDGYGGTSLLSEKGKNPE